MKRPIKGIFWRPELKKNIRFLAPLKSQFTLQQLGVLLNQSLKHGLAKHIVFSAEILEERKSNQPQHKERANKKRLQYVTML